MCWLDANTALIIEGILKVIETIALLHGLLAGQYGVVRLHIVFTARADTQALTQSRGWLRILLIL